MTQQSLANLLEHLHLQVESELKSARSALHHPTDKGDASEQVWINLMTNYLPQRYVVSKAHVVDSEGNFSQQIDVVVHDRQYSPLVFTFQGVQYVPAESVYAVFEAKQETNAETIRYAQTKAESVRRLMRTSMTVPTVDGLSRPRSRVASWPVYSHSAALGGLRWEILWPSMFMREGKAFSSIWAASPMLGHIS